VNLCVFITSGTSIRWPNDYRYGFVVPSEECSFDYIWLCIYLVAPIPGSWLLVAWLHDWRHLVTKWLYKAPAQWGLWAQNVLGPSCSTCRGAIIWCRLKHWNVGIVSPIQIVYQCDYQLSLKCWYRIARTDSLPMRLSIIGPDVIANTSMGRAGTDWAASLLQPLHLLNRTETVMENIRPKLRYIPSIN